MPKKAARKLKALPATYLYVDGVEFALSAVAAAAAPDAGPPPSGAPGEPEATGTVPPTDTHPARTTRRR